MFFLNRVCLNADRIHYSVLRNANQAVNPPIPHISGQQSTGFLKQEPNPLDVYFPKLHLWI